MTYQDFIDGGTNIKFAPKLVLGFHVEHYNTGKETRYALYEDGRIYQSETRDFSHNFAIKGEKWTQIVNIPLYAEFIGNYPMPVK